MRLLAIALPESDRRGITAPTWKMHGGLPGLPLGPEGVRKLFGSFGAIQQKWTIEDVIAEGDKVVIRATNTCIQESFLGIPSRGRQQTFTATFIHSFIILPTAR